MSHFYSSSHDRSTYGSSFINFNLPQFYQIVQLDELAQVIPFRSTTLSHLNVLLSKEGATPVIKQRPYMYIF